MKAIIIANGEFEGGEWWQGYVAGAEIIIASDGGIRHALQLGLTPNLIIGDLDSLDADLMKQLEASGVQILRYSPHKDETDTEMALLHARRLGASEICILGALGGRLDHALANILLLSMPELAESRVYLAAAGYTVSLIRGQIAFMGQVGDILSLLPLGGDVHGIATEGLEYPLRGETLRLGPARGISNVLTASQARVRVQDGLLLAIHFHKEEKMNTRKWNTREIILAANMGLVFGVLFMGWNVIWELAGPLKTSGLRDLFYGFWFIAGIVVAYIVRKPGAALAGGILSALAEMLAGGQWGVTLLLSGLVQGGASELIFAATGWKNYRLPVLIVAGMAASVGSFVVDYFLWYSTLAPAVLAVMFIARLISGAVLAGWLGKVLTDALARTGVLSSYAIGRE